MMRSRVRRTAVLVIALGLIAAACGEDKSGTTTDGKKSSLSGSITVDGSSTLGPLTSAAAELFGAENPNVQITVGTSGTGGGFKKFCAGETDMSDASRPIKTDDEAEGPACEAAGITYTELQIANDGIALVVNKENTWAECMTVAQLKKIWEPAAEGTVTNWNQVDPSFPDQELELFGAGTGAHLSEGGLGSPVGGFGPLRLPAGSLHRGPCAPALTLGGQRCRQSLLGCRPHLTVVHTGDERPAANRISLAHAHIRKASGHIEREVHAARLKDPVDRQGDLQRATLDARAVDLQRLAREDDAERP